MHLFSSTCKERKRNHNNDKKLIQKIRVRKFQSTVFRFGFEIIVQHLVSLFARLLKARMRINELKYE